jgi:hypothetical protein
VSLAIETPKSYDLVHSMNLFETFERTNSRFADHSESHFKFLNRSARARDARMRQVLEEWFSEYPPEHQHELKRRFQSKAGYESAFFELSLHALLKRLNCQLIVHPQIPGTLNHPEFLVTQPDGTTFILEAIIAGGPSAAEASASRLKDTVYDALNRLIKTNDFFVDITVRGTPKQQPSAKQITQFVQRHIAAEDPDAIAALGPNRPRWILTVDDGCTIEFRPHPRKTEVRSKPPERPLGIISPEAEWLDDVTPIRDAVLEKSARYGKLDQPYVVAVNSMAFALEHDDIVEALTDLWGRERIKQVSAVLLASWLMPISAAHAAVGLFHNPAADHLYHGTLTALPQGFTEAGKITLIDGRSLADIFSLPLDWPRLSDSD